MEDRKILEARNGMGLEILSDVINGDEGEEYTFIENRFSTVTDYMIVDERTKEKIEKMDVEERVNSDHSPVNVTFKIAKRREFGQKKEKKRKRREIIVWRTEVR